MLNKIKNRKQEGFTIIEVLIVLAIAGLIMLIVVLAVPALQRNSRNTQREADATKITTAIANCMSARTGQTGSCSSLDNLKNNGGLDTTKLQQLDQTTPVSYTATPTTDSKVANFFFGKKCASDGGAFDSTSGVTVPARQAAVLFLQENGQAAGTIRCIDV